MTSYPSHNYPLALHAIPSSARSRNNAGTLRPNAFAVAPSHEVAADEAHNLAHHRTTRALTPYRKNVSGYVGLGSGASNCSCLRATFRLLGRPIQPGLFPLSWGHNFGPVTLPGFIFFAAAFIACLTSAQVPNGSPHALQDIIMSSVGMLGMSSRPSHLGHLNLVNVRVGGIFYPCNPPKSKIKRMIGIGIPSSQSSNPRPMKTSIA